MCVPFSLRECAREHMWVWVVGVFVRVRRSCSLARVCTHVGVCVHVFACVYLCPHTCACVCVGTRAHSRSHEGSATQQPCATCLCCPHQRRIPCDDTPLAARMPAFIATPPPPLELCGLETRALFFLHTHTHTHTHTCMHRHARSHARTHPHTHGPSPPPSSRCTSSSTPTGCAATWSRARRCCECRGLATSRAPWRWSASTRTRTSPSSTRSRSGGSLCCSWGSARLLVLPRVLCVSFTFCVLWCVSLECVCMRLYASKCMGRHMHTQHTLARMHVGTYAFGRVRAPTHPVASRTPHAARRAPRDPDDRRLCAGLCVDARRAGPARQRDPRVRGPVCRRPHQAAGCRV
jgi:hypothetical protein